MSSEPKSQATSPELTGGAGFTYEDSVAAYYLASLLTEGAGPGQSGYVISVATQQEGHGHPMDDIIVEFQDQVGQCTLGLQAKHSLTISAAATNKDFHSIIQKAIETRANPNFREGRDRFGFVTQHVAVGRLRSLERLIEWARASESDDDFEQRFADGGSAAKAEQTLRKELKPLVNKSQGGEVDFLRHFIALRIDGLVEGGPLYAATANQLKGLFAQDHDGKNILIFDRLRRIVRDGAGSATKWARTGLLSQLSRVVKLNVTPSFSEDLTKLTTMSDENVADICETVDDFFVRRPELLEQVQQKLTDHRLVNISGLPGCGKSVVLKQCANLAIQSGAILFLKSDRLVGSSWSSFASAMGLTHSIVDLLAEIGATGTPTLFIDGIDRVRPDQKGVIVDLLRAIEGNETLANWRVLASSRDQGLEPYRAWFPPSFYRGSGIGDVSVRQFSDEESERLAKQKPKLKRLLFGATAVREIARRPFFAAVLAHNLPAIDSEPQTEIDLISAWWARAGHDASSDLAVLRQRALIDLAEVGVGSLGKDISVRKLKDSTHAQIAPLCNDRIIREQESGASHAFAHDILFEWAFFRLLIELGEDWHSALAEAGEPPLLGRVVGLLAQNSLTTSGKWSAGYNALASTQLRPQWQREWLTAAPFSSAFVEAKEEFSTLLFVNDFALLGKFLVWFQAQHTIPSPVILNQLENPVEGIDNLRIADHFGWPSDFDGWKRMLDWLLPIAATLPIRLRPNVLEVLSVWQNVLSDIRNPRSEQIVAICADWLIQLEGANYGEQRLSRGDDWRDMGREALSNMGSALRTMIIRSARAYPEPAKAIFDRALENRQMRSAAYSELISFTLIMTEVSAEHVIAVTKAELFEELPQDRIDRVEREERKTAKWLESLRAIPESELTDKQKRALESPSMFMRIGRDRFSLDDVGVDNHHSYYFPPSALHEPFASLFRTKPDVAIELVNALANQATEGWRQVHRINARDRGTPIPVVVDFPWGQQQLWGDWHVYSWSLGELAPQPLECAYLAMAYWAFSEIDNDVPTAEIIRKIIEGSSCYASLALALRIALETWEVSETSFPIITCQRLWHHDIARLVNRPMKDIDILGFGSFARLTGEKAKAKKSLELRGSETREVRQLAMLFALGENEELAQRFKAALARFPEQLPYELEEHRSSAGATADLKEKAEAWAGLGDAKNYQCYSRPDDSQVIAYEAPNPPTPEQQERIDEASEYLSVQSAFVWATKSLSENELVDGRKLSDAVKFASAHDSKTLFKERFDVGPHAAQSAVSAIAACVIRFADEASEHREWAWNIMTRVERMAEPEQFSGSKVPWHPMGHLIAALVQDRRANKPRPSSLPSLVRLTQFHLEDVALAAFQGLFLDGDEHVRWTVAGLAIDMSIYWDASYDDEGNRDTSNQAKARQKALDSALSNLGSGQSVPLPEIPPAWIQNSDRRPRRKWQANTEEWGYPDPTFDAQFAAKVFPMFPMETWCQSTTYRPMFTTALLQWVEWTSERLMPSWREDDHGQRDRSADLFEWKAALGDVLAQAAPFFELEWAHEKLLQPFLGDDEETLDIVAQFADRTVCRHVLDAPNIPSNSIPLLDICVDRIVANSTFDPQSYRAGELHGQAMPQLIKALLFVVVENAPGAARLVNGDWSEIKIIMPLVGKLISATGWSPYVMTQYLSLCERVGSAFPIDDFSSQVEAALQELDTARASWSGLMLPARIAAVVRSLSDENYPLSAAQAQGLLKILDGLIDLGDRRSVALEQSEAFRSVQIRN